MAVVDLFACWGQSNMQGRGDAALSPATDPDTCWEWTPTGIVTLDDPNAAPVAHRSNTGCMLPAFANAFTSKSGRPAVFVPSAVGGTALLQDTKPGLDVWGDGSGIYVNARDRTVAAIESLGTGGHTVATVNILWHQGEADAANYPNQETLTADYQAELQAMFALARSDISADLRMYVARVGKTPTKPTEYARVQAAQDAACAATDGMVMAYTRCVDFFDLGWMQADNLHYTQAGLNDMGTQSALVAASDRGWAEPPAPLTRPRTSLAAQRLWSVV